jgi:hypothetical protein
MPKIRKHNKKFKKTRRGGMNNKPTPNINKNTPRPTIKHPNTLPLYGPPERNKTRKILKFLEPETSLTTAENSFFTNVHNGFKGAGIVSSKPISYPLLPESPTNRPPVLTNNESLRGIQKFTGPWYERQKVRHALAQSYQPSILNKYLGRIPKRPPPVTVNSEGYPVRSAFPLNNKGFKP